MTIDDNSKLFPLAKSTLRELRILYALVATQVKRASQQIHTIGTENESNGHEEVPIRFRTESVFSEDAIAREPQRHQDRHQRTQDSIRHAAWATFAAVFLYAGITALQWNEMRKATHAAIKSADTARDALIVSQRPWVSVTKPFRAEVTQVKKNEFSIRTLIPVKNFGPSPALKVIAVWKMIPITANEFGIVEEEAPVKEIIDSMCGTAELVSDPTLFQEGFTLFPNEALTRDGKQTVIIENPSDVVTSALGGCIAYRDQFNKTVHHTRFCLENTGPFMSFKKTGALVPCNIATGAD
jgi:hypothetical protein